MSENTEKNQFEPGVIDENAEVTFTDEEYGEIFDAILRFGVLPKEDMNIIQTDYIKSVHKPYILEEKMSENNDVTQGESNAN